ncbi:MAG: tetratricopeptide repeat protein [Proteiniphilum sp.]|nr:tetratricopeptide repeat protein [Proteiniphilum sp.]
MKIQSLFFTLLFGIFTITMQAQTLEDARTWYLEGRYAEALPLFEQEYQNDPGNASVNQWLGVSLYETGRILEAEKYLSFAAQKKIPESYLYLGELYAKMYQFEDAEAAFEKYQRANRKNEEALDQLTRRLEYAGKLQKAINRTEDIQVIDSLVLPKSKFLSAYNLSKSSGSLLPVNEFFKSLIVSDKTLYMNGREDKIYYSQGDQTTGFDLFTMDKLIDTFGNEKKLPGSVNEDGDQAYPFVMSDGLTLYFASTGHASLGGYDLYVTRYNLPSDTYLTPNQLNMPFNSPFNDYLMVIDEEKGIGWFASDRFQPPDSVCVYTFIPNPQVTLLESDDPGVMIKRARLSAIADTWKADANYDLLRERARQKIVTRQETEGDFVFVINDSATYHTLSDFRNNSARQIFSQALGLERQWHDLNRDLSEKREQYANGHSNEAFQASILSMEKEVYTLYREIERLKIQARNEEIRANYE